MAKKPSRNTSKRKREGGKRPLIVLLVLVLLIVAVIMGLEWLRNRMPPPTESPPVTVERRQMPPRLEHKEYDQRPYTSLPAPSASLPKKPRPSRVTGSGNVAIIIDDMGTSVQEARELLAIGLPITFSVIPGLAKDRAVADMAYQQGGRVMLHIPMEPQGYPERRLEKNGLLLSQSEGEIVERVRGYLQAVPHAIGANNHMGSRFTEDSEKMVVVLTVLKEKGLFFIDSMTSPRSVGLHVARELGMEAGARNVFLDNVQDVGAIKTQLEQAVRIARRRGGAIAIGHPHPATIRALQEMMPALKESGINFVYVSALVR